MTTTAGYLKLIIGPMFSGKTSKLITIYQRNKIADISTCVVNYHEDTRYHPTLLSSHDRRMIPCMRVKRICQVFERNPDILKNTDAFVINEGQFFEDLYEAVWFLVMDHGKIVYVAGLDGDYQMRKFGQMLDLVPLADEVEKLQAICMGCKGVAAFTKRLTDETKQKVIGSDNYIPVCRRCHAATSS